MEHEVCSNVDETEDKGMKEIGMHMIGEIKDVISMFYNLYRSNMDKKYNDFNNYITEIFDKTKIIAQNYTDVLSKVRYGVVHENWNGDIVVKYLEKVEYELKSERIYIREELKHLNRIYNGELEPFVGGILNIMYCEYIDRFKHGKDIEHRFTGLIRDAKQFQYDLFYRQKFIEDVNGMLKDVNISWNIVCAEYFKLKEKYGNEF